MRPPYTQLPEPTEPSQVPYIILGRLHFCPRELQNSIWRKICAFGVGLDFSQTAYSQQDMSVFEKPNRHQNHQILLSKPVLQFPRPVTDQMPRDIKEIFTA